MPLLPTLNNTFLYKKERIDRTLSVFIDNSYSTISLKESLIQCSFFVYIQGEQNRSCQINFSAISCNLLFHLISKHRSLYSHMSFYHILYMGKEIYKAELSQIFKQKYRQS